MAKSPSRAPNSKSKGKVEAPKPARFTSGMITLTIILVLIAFGAGFGAITIQADLTQPVASSGSPQAFVVNGNDGMSSIADHLEKQHLIRNALIFKLYLKVRGINPKVQAGTYQISPTMSISEILNILQSTPQPSSEAVITVKPGDRLSQYYDDIVKSAYDYKAYAASGDAKTKNPVQLPNFKKDDFTKIILNGTFTGSDKFWFLQPWDNSDKGGAKNKLEGYLWPDTYRIDPNSTADDIVHLMVTAFGEQLCPNPNGDPAKYIDTQDDCKAHQAMITPQAISDAGFTISQPVGVFDALSKSGLTLPQALTLASIVQREARSVGSMEAVASTYYNRFKRPGDSDTAGFLGAEPAEQYEIGTGATGDPWLPLQDALSNLPDSPYNLQREKGLPPSAIAGVSQSALYGAIDPAGSDYFYFYFGKDCKNYYFKFYADFNKGLAHVPAALPTDCQ
jgi:UPF0755 protein